MLCFLYYNLTMLHCPCSILNSVQITQNIVNILRFVLTYFCNKKVEKRKSDKNNGVKAWVKIRFYIYAVTTLRYGLRVLHDNFNVINEYTG